MASNLLGTYGILDQFGDNTYGYNGLTDSSLNTLIQGIREDQNKIWQREDTAYQRMVADMKAAGLNPWTGIASGGLSTSSNNASSDMLKGLITGLDYNRKSSDSVRKSDEKFWDQMIDLFQTFSNFAGKLVGK